MRVTIRDDVLSPEREVTADFEAKFTDEHGNNVRISVNRHGQIELSASRALVLRGISSNVILVRSSRFDEE